MTEYVDHFVGETRRLIDSGFESAQCAVTDFKNFDTGGLFDPEEAKKYGVETNFVKGVQPWEQLFAISVLAQGFLWLRRSPHSINLMVSLCELIIYRRFTRNWPPVVALPELLLFFQL
jgi:hypothetical protein